MGILDAPNNRILKGYTKVQDAVETLAEHVDNQRKHIRLFGSTYKVPDAKEVSTVRVDGLEIGYRLEDHQVFMRRIIYMKVPGYKVTDISEDERERIMTALFNVFFLPGGKIPEIKQIAPDCLLITHDFVPDILVEKKPGLVSIAGGFGNEN